MDAAVQRAVNKEQRARHLRQEPADAVDQLQEFVGGEHGVLLVAPRAELGLGIRQVAVVVARLGPGRDQVLEDRSQVEEPFCHQEGR